MIHKIELDDIIRNTLISIIDKYKCELVNTNDRDLQFVSQIIRNEVCVDLNKIDGFQFSGVYTSEKVSFVYRENFYESCRLCEINYNEYLNQL